MGRTAAVDPPMYEGTPMYMYVRYITTLRQGTAHERTRMHTSAHECTLGSAHESTRSAVLFIFFDVNRFYPKTPLSLTSWASHSRVPIPTIRSF